MRFKTSNLKSQICAIVLVSILAARFSSSHAETLLLTGATIHTVSGKIIVEGSVLIDGSKIERVIEGSAPSNVKADKVIDLKGLHLFPGLIALDTALGLSEISGVRATRDFAEAGEYTPDVQSWIAVNPDSELIPVARANGITHIEPAPQGGIVTGQSGLVALNGWTVEDMAIKSPVALHVHWPSMELNTTPKDEFRDKSKWKSLDEQAKERQKKLKELEDFFDEARAYAKAKESARPEGADTLELDPAWEAMLPFVRGELPLMIHANDLRQIKAAVKWAEENKYKMILVGGRDAWMSPELLASKKIPVVYEHIFNQPSRSSDPYDVNYKAPEVMRKSGVQVIISMGPTAFDAGLIKNLPYYAAQAVAFGLPQDEALKGITLYPAQVLGIADRLGSIEAGKEATFFAVDGNILDIRTNVKRLWIAGKEASLETRHTRLYEKYKSRPRAK